ncbi:hypothetical protein CYMTET_54663 [Cymbomonas tetramitiformis]|uniref:Uncharacterized protein n=1 Tax=Cymbomonas tetramitiformis TaxID=36881 RepID=A0AAE0EP48_9CHLO|nr:hypothetical protein CYMTET_54663 [Cymbomonas tetramitiformis]
MEMRFVDVCGTVVADVTGESVEQDELERYLDASPSVDPIDGVVAQVYQAQNVAHNSAVLEAHPATTGGVERIVNGCGVLHGDLRKAMAEGTLASTL